MRARVGSDAARCRIGPALSGHVGSDLARLRRGGGRDLDGGSSGIRCGPRGAIWRGVAGRSARCQTTIRSVPPPASARACSTRWWRRRAAKRRRVARAAARSGPRATSSTASPGTSSTTSGRSKIASSRHRVIRDPLWPPRSFSLLSRSLSARGCRRCGPWPVCSSSASWLPRGLPCVIPISWQGRRASPLSLTEEESEPRRLWEVHGGRGLPVG